MSSAIFLISVFLSSSIGSAFILCFFFPSSVIFLPSFLFSYFSHLLAMTIHSSFIFFPFSVSFLPFSLLLSFFHLLALAVHFAFLFFPSLIFCQYRTTNHIFIVSTATRTTTKIIVVSRAAKEGIASSSLLFSFLHLPLQFLLPSYFPLLHRLLKFLSQRRLA